MKNKITKSKRKYFKMLGLLGATVLISSLSTLHLISSSTHRLDLVDTYSTLNDNTNSLNNNSINRTAINQGDFLIDTNNGISLKQYIVYPNKPAVAGENGYLVFLKEKATDNTYVGYIPFDGGGNVEWTCPVSDCFDAFYNKKTKSFIVLGKGLENINHISIYNLREKDGASYNQFFKDLSVNYSDFRMNYYSDGESIDLLISPRDLLNQQARLKSTFHVKVTYRGTTPYFKEINDSWVDSWDGNSWLLGFKPILSGQKNILATIIANENHEIWVRIFEDFKFVVDWNTGIVLDKDFSNSDLNALFDNVVDMASFSFYNNDHNANCVNFKYIIPGNNSQLLDFKYNLSTKQIFSNVIVNINNSNYNNPSATGPDIDFNSNMQWVGNKLYALPNTLIDSNRNVYNNSVVIIDFTSPSYSTENVFSPAGDSSGNMQIYSITNEYVKANQPINIIGYDSNFILLSNSVETTQKDYMWIVDTTLNNKQGGWAYQTGTINNHEAKIVLENASNLLANKYRNDKDLKILINTSMVRNIATRMRSDFEYEFIDFDMSQETAALGQIKCNLFVKNAYVNGNFTGLSGGAKISLTIMGFKTNYTSFKKITFPNLGDPSILNSEVDNQWIIDLFNAKYSEIFNNLPIPYDFSVPGNVSIESIDSSVPGEITFTVTLNNVLTPTKTLTETINIKGFKIDKPSTIIDAPITVYGFSYASECVKNLNNPSLIKAIIDSGKIKNIANNQKLEPNDIEISEPSEIDDLNGELYVSITIKNNKSLVYGQVFPKSTFKKILINGFKTRKPTTVVQNNLIIDSTEFVGNINNYSDEKIISYVMNHMSIFFNNVPDGITPDDIVVNAIRNKFLGEIRVKVTLKKYYSPENGLLIIGEPGITGDYVLKGNFDVEKLLSTQLKKEVEIIRYNSKLFKQIFGNDKGFVADWINEKTQKQNFLKTWMNENMNIFLNDYFLMSEDGSITKQTSVKNIVLETRGADVAAIITFNDWLLNGEIEPNHKETILFVLKTTPSGNSLVVSSIQKEYDIKGDKITLDDIKEIIVNALNNNLNNIPNVCIPISGRFTIYDIDISGEFSNVDGVMKIPGFTIGIGDAKIVFESMQFTKSKNNNQQNNNGDNKNWVLPVIIVSVVLAVLIIVVLIVWFILFRKRRWYR